MTKGWAVYPSSQVLLFEVRREPFPTSIVITRTLYLGSVYMIPYICDFVKKFDKIIRIFLIFRREYVFPTWNLGS